MLVLRRRWGRIIRWGRGLRRRFLGVSGLGSEGEGVQVDCYFGFLFKIGEMI